jgi:cytochrome c oxidase cbb3-type subunit III
MKGAVQPPVADGERSTIERRQTMHDGFHVDHVAAHGTARWPRRRRRSGAAAMLAAIATIAAGAFTGGATFGDDADAAHGRTLYRVLCTQCHGVGGDGRGVNTRDMAVQPRDHTDTGEMSARTDADLFKAIQGGGKAVNKSVLMPAWGGNLSDEDISALVAYLRELCCTGSQ